MEIGTEAYVPNDSPRTSPQMQTKHFVTPDGLLKIYILLPFAFYRPVYRILLSEKL